MTPTTEQVVAEIGRWFQSFKKAEAAKDKAAQREAVNNLGELAAQAARLARESGWGSEAHRALAAALQEADGEVASVSPALEREGWRWPDEDDIWKRANELEAETRALYMRFKRATARRSEFTHDQLTQMLNAHRAAHRAWWEEVDRVFASK